MTPINFFKKGYEKIPNNVKKAFIFSIIFGIICHFYMMTNKLTNHDDLEQLFNIMDLRTSARWFLQYATSISSYLSMPWVNGSLVILYLAISNALIVDLFKIKNTISIMILSALLVTFPGIVAIMPYMQSADGYFLACLLSVIGAYAFIKSKRFKFLFIILNVLSLATYQIFLGYSIGIVLVYYLIEAIFEDLEFNETFKKTFILAIYTILTLVLYVISVKYIFPVELTSYQGLNKIGFIDFAKLPLLTLRTYTHLLNFFLIDGFEQFGFIKYLNYILFIISIFSLIYCILNAKKDIKTKLFTFLIAFILPIFINLVVILAPDTLVGLRMRYSSVLVYILEILLIERFLENKKTKFSIAINWTIFIILILTIFKFILVSNQVYMSLDIDSRNLEAYTNRIITRIEEKEYYSRNKKIVFLGSPDIRTDFTQEYFDKTVESSLLLKYKIPKSNQWALYPERYSAFPNEISYNRIGIVPKIFGKDKKLMKKIRKAPIYPHKNSIFEHNGKIYIKFQSLKKAR